MILNSKRLACDVEFNEDAVLTFSDGLYGLEDIKKYIIIESDEPGNPFKWLHSLENDICFVVIDPRHIEPEYDFDLHEDAVLRLGADNTTEFMLLSIVVVTDRIEDMTANLRSPVVINSDNNKGMQVILDEEAYGIRHKVIK